MNTKDTSSIEGNILTTEQFYKEARKWAAIVRNKAKSNTASFKKGKEDSHTYKTGKKAGKTEKKLSKSTRFIITQDNKVPESIGFKVPIHGIFREWAVGYGQPRVAGKYKAPHNHIKRSMNDWIDNPIEKNSKRLFDLAAEYWGDQVLLNTYGAKGINYYPDF